MRRGGVKTLQKSVISYLNSSLQRGGCRYFHLVNIARFQYRVFQYLLTPPPFPQPYCVMVHLKSIYFQNPISIPDYHARFHKSRGNSVLDVVFPTRYAKWIFIFLIVLVEKRHQTIRNPVCVTLLYLSHIKQGNYT